MSFIGVAFCLVLAASSFGQVVLEHPRELEGITIDEHLGKQIPLNLEFMDDAGRSVTLNDYFQQGKPVILNLVYYNCPMLCNLLLNGVTSSVRQLAWTPGDEFTMVSVSINPRETFELANAKKQNYLNELGKPGADAGWHFLVSEEAASKALADAVGFGYRWDEERQEYAHSAATFILSPDGTISRYLYGLEYSERDLRLALVEASRGEIGSTLDKLILYCYHYDPEANSYVPFATNLMKLGGLGCVLILGTFLAVMIRRDRARVRAAHAAQPAIRQL